MDAQKPPPGWYSDPDAVDVKRYWDGEGWTNERAARNPPPGTSPWVIAGGILIAAAVIWFIYGAVTANDALACSTRNAERVLGERAGPAEVCPN